MVNITSTNKSQTVPEIKSNKREQFARWIERKQEGYSSRLMKLLSLYLFTMVLWSGQGLITSCASTKTNISVTLLSDIRQYFHGKIPFSKLISTRALWAEGLQNHTLHLRNRKCQHSDGKVLFFYKFSFKR